MGFQHRDVTTSARHKRSKSFPDKRGDEGNCDDSIDQSPRLKLDMDRMKAASESKKKSPSNTGTQNLLKQEIQQLEKRLQDQFHVRRTLEKALGSGTSSCDTDQSSMPKPATKLINEIAVLELEVGHLERYLLSLYRKAFDQQVSSVSPTTVKEQIPQSPVMTPKRLFVDDVATQCDAPKAKFASKLHPNPHQDPGGFGIEEKMFKSGRFGFEEKTHDASVHRCHSTLSHRSKYPMQNSSTNDALTKALQSCHSQPMSGMEYAQNTASNMISLAEYLGTRVSDHVPETPNRISEEMVKSMAAIFCKLAEPPSVHNGLSSPNSSASSIGAFSPNYQCDAWSPSFAKDSSFEMRLDNPFNVEGLKEFSGPYSTMVEVPCIYRDSQKLADVELMLQNFKSLISRLQEINPKKMTHEEKIAFWINIHNALVMHAFLAYGIPQSNMKKVFLLLKAAYNVGGHTISADTIQSTILGCRMSRPGQWIRMIVSPKTKFKFGDDRQAYAIDQPEPLLHFALCSGSHSDPADLEASKDEYIRATFGMRKDQKLILPKLLETYAKDSGLSTASIVETIQQSLPDSLRKSLKKCHVGKSKKSIEWVPHNFSFRYLVSKELLK
ncbi:hypothetical protein V2J09_021676 [Rumex salicifolius]